MGKHNPSSPGKRASGPEASPETSGGAMRLLAVVVAAAVIGIGGMNLYETRQQRAALEERLSLLEGQITALGSKVEAAAKPVPQPRQPAGPDPDKVYAVKTDGSPAEGPKSAPVTIAEFSDFQ